MVKIKKFNLINNGKVVYAVTGVKDSSTAMDVVRKYKKEKTCKFEKEHSCIAGTIYRDKLYVGSVDGLDPKRKKECLIVARNSYNL